MDLFWLVLMGVIVVVLCMAAGVGIFGVDTPLGIGICFLGILSLVMFAFMSAQTIRMGYPIIDIDQGTYQVAFVYQAGDNVSLGLETLAVVDDKKQERLYFYQFDKKAFEGEISTKAKNLIVIEVGDFKKLRLQ